MNQSSDPVPVTFAGVEALDSYDRRILATLADEGRMSWRELSDRIGLSLTPTLRRVRRLEEDGYIEGYEARLNEHRLIGGMSVFVSVSLGRQAKDALIAFDASVIGLPEVMECYLMTGDADYLLRIVVRDLDHYQRVVNTLAQIPDINHIKSSFALRRVTQRRSPPIG
jgi:Lrp/AsnC family transcriptional regulator, leucine-responsive regulatory protein